MQTSPALSLPQPPRPRRLRRLALPLVALAVFLAIVGVARAAEGQLSFKEHAPEFSLPEATEVVGSPDGKFLYATHGDSLTVLARDADSGELSWVETEHDDTDDPSDPGATVEGLHSATSVAISPDGRSVYATGFLPDNAIAVFERDPASGRLSFLEAEVQDVDDPSDPGGSVFAMSRPEAITVTSDGGSVYVRTSSSIRSLAAFERDPTGRISYVETEREGINDPDDAGGAPDGLYGGSGLASSGGADRDDGGSVYVTSREEDKVAAFKRDPATSELSFVEVETDGVEDADDKTGTADGLSRAEAVVASPDGGFVYVVGRFDNAIAVFKRDSASGGLIFVEAERNWIDDPGDPGGAVSDMLRPVDVALSAEGGNLYATTSGGNVVSFRHLPESGELSFVAGEVTGEESLDRILVAGDGRHAYATGEELPGFAVLSRDSAGAPGFGALRFEYLAPEIYFGESPRGAAISPDGRHLVSASIERVWAFSRDPGSGSILAQVDVERHGVDDPSDPGGEIDRLYEPATVSFSGDGRFVYVGDFEANAIHVFEFDTASGELSWLESERDGTDDPGDAGGEVEGLRGASDLVLAPDGSGVYAVGVYDDGLAAFDRDPASGRLSFVEAEIDGESGVEGLRNPTALSISPDGRGIVVASETYAEVGVFSRNPATNEIGFLEIERRGVDDPTDPGGPVAGVNSLADVLLGPAGSVFLTGEEGLVRFQRDPGTGLLSFAEWETDEVDGLSNGRYLALSQGGSSLYVASSDSPFPGGETGALAVFAVAPGSGALSFLEAKFGGLTKPSALIVAPDERFVHVLSSAKGALTTFERELASPAPPAPPAPPAALPAPPAPAAASPAPAPPRADSSLDGASIEAARKQRQRGRSVVVTLTAKAGERAAVAAWGKVRVGKRSYKLKPAKRSLRPGKAAKLKLRPAKAAQRKKIAAALRRGAKVRAVVTARIADPAGNQLRRKLNIRLLTTRR